MYLGVHAADPRLSRLVAIKVVHEHLAHNRMFIDMLLDEAKVAGKLHHPNVVGIIDFGEFQRRHFVVMPYVEGGTVSELVRRHRRNLPIGLMVRAVIDALHGLHAAHTLVDDQGRPLALVHRDVSPGNILVGTDGIARVIDFGVAKAASRITHTAPGMVKGKFSYMAPEQAMGEAIDHRADVFSAGVVLWTVLTGKRLFTGKNSAHTIRNLMTAEVLPPSRIRPGLPYCFDDVCLRALQRNPDERYQSAAEMAEALYSAAILSEAMLEPDDVSRWVADAFAKRISQRRALIERVRASAGSGSADHLSFDLDAVDLDGREPAGSTTPPTPSGHVKGAPSGILEQLGAEDLSSGIRRMDPHRLDPFSSVNDWTSSVRDMRASITPGEAPSISDMTPKARPRPAGAERDHTGESSQKRPRGRGRLVALLAVLLGVLAGAGFALREDVLRLADDWGLLDIIPGAMDHPSAQPPTTLEPVIIQVDDIADAGQPAPAPEQAPAPPAAALQRDPALPSAQPPEAARLAGAASLAGADAGATPRTHAEEPAGELDGPDEARGRPAAGARDRHDAPDAARDRDEDRSRSRKKRSKRRRKSSSRREPRDDPRGREPEEPRPVTVEKKPYED